MIVPFEIAKELKDLGYDEQVRNYYEIEFGERTFESYSSDYNTLSRYEDKRVSAPSVSSALQWIRENKGVVCGVFPVVKELKNQEKPVGIFYEHCFIDYKRCPTVKINELYSHIAIFSDYPSAELALLESIIKYLKK